jgi:hypothetical protein
MIATLLVRGYAPLPFLSNVAYSPNDLERLLKSIVRDAESSMGVYISKIQKDRDDVDACARLVDVARRFDHFHMKLVTY